MPKQLALLSYVRDLLPSGVQVSLVGDCEFGHSQIIQHLREWQWDYALRESGQTLVGLYEGQSWLRLDELLPHAGTLVRLCPVDRLPCPSHTPVRLLETRRTYPLVACHQSDAPIGDFATVCPPDVD